MRFELSVALKYLIPKWRQLSVSIISLVSILVISLVVWLVIVFLSVTEGLEKKWIQELVALNAPLRMTPTEKYYNSYYYLVDAISYDSNYMTKSIGEKLASAKSDPYDLNFDRELPADFPQPELTAEGALIDPVKGAYSLANSLESKYEGIRPSEYEVTFGNLNLGISQPGKEEKNILTQLSYIASYDPNNTNFQKLLIPAITHPMQSLGNGIIVSKHFQKSGVQLGDKGYIAYHSAGLSSGEQRLP